MCGQLLEQTALSLGKNTMPTIYGNGWTPELFWIFLHKRNTSFPDGIQTQDRPACSLVAVPSTLCGSVRRNSAVFCCRLIRNCTEELLKLTGPSVCLYRGADKSLARPTSQCILFNGENISFDASLVIYINSTNIPPIVIINRIYEHQNLLSL
jgi:hypothetical protein